MDYFNKSFIPLDVNGNPILTRAQQEELQLERDLEAAGFAGNAASESTRVRIHEASRILQQSETDGTYPTPLLPVDKGIFRRKVNHPSAHAGAQASTHSAASGISGEEDESARGNNNTMSALGMSGKSTASGMNADQVIFYFCFQCCPSTLAMGVLCFSIETYTNIHDIRTVYSAAAAVSVSGSIRRWRRGRQ